MAEEEKKTEEGQEEAQEGGGKSNKKLIIIIAIVAILAIGLSVGATLYLLGGDDASQTTETDAEANAVKEPVKVPASYFDIKPAFLVTFNVGGHQRYMQVGISVSSRDASAFDALEHHMPLVRSKLISTYGGLNFDEIQTNDGKLALQQKTVEVINGVLEGEGALPIENVFFTNFVLQ